MWDLWLTKWHWGRFLSQSFGFSLSVSFHRCSIFTQISFRDEQKPGLQRNSPIETKIITIILERDNARSLQLGSTEPELFITATPGENGPLVALIGEKFPPF
jgi:hypothetical protein